ncbi:MAG: transcriptional regulator [Tardiphaga sp.]|jgi:antitoxin PrlF|nr:transcriptional regulator [Tardiphaga sp.]
MIKSKIDSKARTTIPSQVRDALRLRTGDEVVYTIEHECVVLARAGQDQLDFPFATFAEWNSEADRKAYRDL